MMKKRLLPGIAALLISLPSFAQSFITEDPSFSLSARTSAAFDWKIAKGLHLNVSEELRFVDSSSKSLVRSYSTLGASYKVCPYLKVGAGYSFIACSKTKDDVTSPLLRHRVYGEITGMYGIGNIKLSLREKIQGTVRTDDFNAYQEPGTAWMLRSRLKVSYDKKKMSWKPYAAFEVSNTLNAVNFVDSWNGVQLVGDDVIYNDIYVNRLRTRLGVDWRLSKRSSVDLYLLYDFKRGKDIDATKKGKLVSVTGEMANVISLGIAYTFSK